MLTIAGRLILPMNPYCLAVLLLSKIHSNYRSDIEVEPISHRVSEIEPPQVEFRTKLDSLLEVFQKCDDYS